MNLEAEMRLGGFLFLFGLIPVLAFASGKPKPSEDEYVEKRLQDCITFEEKSEEACDRDLRQQFRKAPYLEPAEFVRRLMKLKNLEKKISTVTRTELDRLTRKIRALPIDFTEEMDGCDGRAETIAYVLSNQEKINVLNIALVGHLEIESKFIPLDHALIAWGHHVAPAILVKEADGKIVPYSLDLTLLEEPRPLVEWLEKVTARSSTLVEIHALPKTETSPPVDGEIPPVDFTDAQVSLIEARLAESPVRGIRRSSPLRIDRADAFWKALQNHPIPIVTPFEADADFPQGEELVLDAFDGSIGAALEKQVRTSLRCQDDARGFATCGVFFWTQAPSRYCEISLRRAAGARDFQVNPESASVRCYRFSGE